MSNLLMQMQSITYIVAMELDTVTFDCNLSLFVSLSLDSVTIHGVQLQELYSGNCRKNAKDMTNRVSNSLLL